MSVDAGLASVTATGADAGVVDEHVEIVGHTAVPYRLLRGRVHHHVSGSARVMPTVTIEADRSIFYETSGEGPQQLVFVHGFRNSTESWTPVRDRLNPGRSTSWYLDLPGTGHSFTPETWADCTIA